MIEILRQRWRECDRRTAEMIESSRAVDPAFTPAPGYRSVRDQVAHLIAARESIVRGVATGEFPWKAAIAACASLDLGELDTARAGLTDRLEQLLEAATEEWLGEKVASLTRSDWFWALTEHETHHIGQLSMTVRLAGGEPATIFD